MNLIECTIKMKEEGRAHYERLSNAVVDKELKQLFSLLSAAEEEHLGKLRKMSDKIKLGFNGSIKIEESVCVFRPLLDTSNLSRELRDDPDAYRHVIAEEKEAIEFYDQLAAESEGETMKQLCRILAREERKHLEKVENIYSFVEDPRTYLEWGEFSNIKTL